MTDQQKRDHSHSHGFGHHHHHHDNAYLVSKNKNDPGVKITRIGLYVNLGMALSKGVGGYVFHSQALVADAVHSLTDLVSDIMTLATITWSFKPPTSRFPSGYGKVESLGSLGVSSLLLFGGIMMGWSAVGVLLQQLSPDLAHTLADWGLLGHGHGHSHGHDHSHSHTDLGPNINAAWLAGGSIIIKEWLFRATLKIAKERKSSVLSSNAYHHRVDSLTALVALLMIGGSNVLENASWLDPVGGLAISLMVISAGYGNSKQSLLELADVTVEEEMTSKLRKNIDKALVDVPGSIQVGKISGLKSGQNYLMDAELAAPKSWTIDRTRSVEDDIRDKVSHKIRGLKRLRIRWVTIDEAQAGSVSEEFVGADVSPRESPEPEDHDHDHDHDHSSHSHGANGLHKRK